jgi:hypothetical protein
MRISLLVLITAEDSSTSYLRYSAKLGEQFAGLLRRIGIRQVNIEAERMLHLFEVAAIDVFEIFQWGRIVLLMFVLDNLKALAVQKKTV